MVKRQKKRRRKGEQTKDLESHEIQSQKAGEQKRYIWVKDTLKQVRVSNFDRDTSTTRTKYNCRYYREDFQSKYRTHQTRLIKMGTYGFSGNFKFNWFYLESKGIEGEGESL